MTPATEETLYAETPEDATGTGNRKRRRLLWSFLRRPTVLLAALVFVTVILVAAFAPQLAPYDPAIGELSERLLPPVWSGGGSAAHPLGTDSLGRDVLSRLFHGSRVSLSVGLGGVILGGGIGVCVGVLTGYYGGWLDDVLMRLADIQLAFPFILLAIALLVAIGPGIFNLIIVLSLSNWVTFARVTRGEVLLLRELPFVEASRALGARDLRIMLRSILPNIVAPITVIATFSFAELIVAEAALSFLGLGVPPSIPTWGGMLSEGKEYIVIAWWLATLPGVAIMLTVLSINLLGDWLRDYLDPRINLRS